jgi:outer membrane protein
MRRLIGLLIAVVVLSGARGIAEEKAVRSLTVEEAVTAALASNVDIAVQRLVDRGSVLDLKKAGAVYEPYLTSSVGHTNAHDAPTDSSPGSLSGASDIASTSDAWSAGIEQRVPTGGKLRLQFDNQRTTTNDTGAIFSPGYMSRLGLSFQQPLLRGLRSDDERLEIRLAKTARAVSEQVLRRTALDVVAAVKAAYFDLVYAVEYRDAQRRLRAWVDKLQEDNRERVRAGVLPRFDLLLGDSELAAREQALVEADGAVARAEDALKQLILTPEDEVGWGTRLDPVDRPAVQQPHVDVDAVLDAALHKRTDVVAAQLETERAEILRRHAREQKLPTVDAVGAYQSAGWGGTGIVRDPVTQEIVARQPGGYGDVLDDLLARRHPTWSLSLQLAYPLLNRQARVAEARATVAREEAEARLRRLRVQVITEVRDAVRSVELDHTRVERARETYDFQKQRLDAEMERMTAGRSSPFFVIQAQRDLAISEVSHLSALADYRKSLVRLERVQESALDGGGVRLH